MPYIPPNPAAFRARLTKFSTVDDATIQGALDRAARDVDASWLDADRTEGLILRAAHGLTEDGFGDGTEAQLLGEGVNDFQRIKLGPLDLARFDRARAAGAPEPSEFETTSYGRRFLALARRNVGGPIVC